MTLTERVRQSIPQQLSLRRVSLRTKLVASVLALVLAALSLISASSTYYLHSFLVRQMDTQLATFASDSLDKINTSSRPLISLYLPSDYLFSVKSTTGVGNVYRGKGISDDDLPPPPTSVEAIDEHNGIPYTGQSIDSKYRWRILVLQLSNGSILFVGQRMTGVEAAIARLAWVDFLVGLAVLTALASIGAAIVRQSLIPLLQIERTATAIGNGDLTQRVVDPEADGGDTDRPASTELGRLSRSLNAMLAQIEAAFIAREESETVARLAEAVARGAAEDAKASETRARGSEAKMRQFVADASHELRTPLTSIRGFAELYRQGAVADPADVARLVRRIEDEAARMGLLVEDLLLLARLDRERPLTLAPVELPVLALDAVQAAEATAPERTIRLDIRDEPDRLVAYGDDARLRQVIGNLITNALVHTPPEAEVTVRLYAEPNDRAVIEIADTGPGLTDEQKAHVFERFYRADEARTRDTTRTATGTGLGLAIVAAIVRSHQGTVDVLSDPGGGATFKVTLPAFSPALNVDKAFSENIQG